MIGLTFSVLFALILLAFGKTWQETYVRATRFLTVWSLLMFLFVCLIWVSLTVAGGTLGSLLMGTSLGTLIGLFGLGLVASGMLVVVFILSMFQLLGAYLMSTSLLAKANRYEWRKIRLIIGVFFFVIGVSKAIG